MRNRVAGWLGRNELLVILMAGVVLLRLPSLFEPYWYGDENIYLTLGREIRNGRTLYKDIHDWPNKPPLLYLLAAMGDGELFWFKLAGMGAAVLGLVGFWRLAGNWPNRLLAAAVFLALTNMPFFEGNVVNAEVFFVAINLWAFYLLQEKGKGAVVRAGVLIGVASLFKVQASIELLVWPVYWLTTEAQGAGSKIAKLMGGWLIPTGVVGGVYVLAGMGLRFTNEVVRTNFGYVSGEGLAWRWAGLTAGLAVLYCLRKRLERQMILWLIWLGVGLFAVLLSGRPYPHYWLQVTGPISLGVGIFIGWRGKEKLMVAAGGVMLAAVWMKFGFYRYRVLGYYANFGAWVAGEKTQDEYFGWFGPEVNKDYEIAKIILAGSNKDDRLLVWSDDPGVYALANRPLAAEYTARYHVLESGKEREVVNSVIGKRPKYVVVENQDQTGKRLIDQMEGDYWLEKEWRKTRVYRRLGSEW